MMRSSICGGVSYYEMRKARNDYRCYLCERIINKGEEYYTGTVIVNNRYFNGKFHNSFEFAWYYVQNYCDLNFEPVSVVFCPENIDGFLLAIVYEESGTGEQQLFGHLIYP